MKALKTLDVPSEWREVLETVRRVYGGRAVLHGGSMRDLALGKPVKDLDIGVPYVDPLYSDWLAPRYKLPPDWTYSPCSFKQNRYKQGVVELVNVENFKVPGLIQPVQVITYRYPVQWFAMHTINRNDFGINQIGFDGQRIIWSEHFKKDFTKKRFTHVYCKYAYQAQHALNRAAEWKYSGKYPGFTFDTTLGERLVREATEPSKVEIVDNLENLLA